MNKKLSLIIFSIFLSINFVFAQNDTYVNVGGNIDGSTSTTISNTGTGGLVDTARYVGLMASAAIVTLVIFKLIEGAVLKGTYDNIYDQQKGNKILKNAVVSFLIFIFVNLLFSYINPDYGSWIFNTNVTSTTNTTINNDSGGNIAGQCTNDPAYYSKSVEDQIKQDEEGGKHKSWVYMDSTGHPTIGWGFNLAQSGASQIMKEAGIDANTVSSLLSTSCKNVSANDLAKAADKNCPTTISKEQADALFNTEIAKHKTNINNWVGGEDKYKALPVNIQKVLLNMMYNTGSGSMSKFVKLKAAIQATPLNYDNIAAEIIDSDYCKQVKGRCGRLIGLVYNGKCPTNTASNNTSLAGQNNKNTTDTCNQILKMKTSDLVDLNSLGVPCDSSESTCFVSKEFGNEIKKVAADYNKKFPKRKFKVTSAYRSDEQQTKICTIGSGKDSACAPSCKTSNNTAYSNHQLGNAIDVSNDTIGGCSKKGACNSLEFKYLKAYSSIFKNNLREDNVHFSMTGR